MLTVAISLFIVPFLLGCLLLFFGIYGKQSDSHLHCRKCRFNLHNLPPSSSRCPECGADLSLPRATQTGLRLRQPRLYLPGLVILILLAASLIPILRGSLNSNTLLTYVPNPTLAYLLRTSTGSLSAPVATEALTRLQSPQTSTANQQSLITALLLRQADLSVNWLYEHDDLALFAQSALLMTDKQWEKYLSQGIQSASLHFNLPPSWHQRATPTFDVALRNVRLANSIDLDVIGACGTDPDTLMVSPTKSTLVGVKRNCITFAAGRQIQSEERLVLNGIPYFALLDLPTGRHHIHLKLAVSISSHDAMNKPLHLAAQIPPVTLTASAPAEITNHTGWNTSHIPLTGPSASIELTASPSSINFLNTVTHQLAIYLNFTDEQPNIALLPANASITTFERCFYLQTTLDGTTGNVFNKKPEAFITVTISRAFDPTQSDDSCIQSLTLRSNPRLAERLLDFRSPHLAPASGIWHLPNTNASVFKDKFGNAAQRFPGGSRQIRSVTSR